MNEFIEPIKRLAHRPGFVLADVKEVGLPVAVVSIDVLLEARHPIPLIELFIYKLVAAGIGATDDISALLGLQLEIVDQVAIDACTKGMLAREEDGGLHVTDRLALILNNESFKKCVERTVTAPFDGVLWKPVSADAPLQTSGQLADSAAELHPVNHKRVSIDDLDASAVETALRSNGAIEATDRLLAIRGVAKSRQRFVRAIALLFLPQSRGGNYELAFAIDGRLSPAHEACFAEKSSKRGRLFSALNQSGDSVPSNSAIRSVFRRLVAAESKRLGVKQGPRGKRGPLTLSATAAAPQDRLSWDVPLAEMYGALEASIRGARHSLLIITRAIRGSMLTPELVDLFVERAKDGVSFTLLIYPEHGSTACDALAERGLRRLTASPNVSMNPVPDYGDAGCALIRDDEFAVVTNFGFLSSPSEPQRPFEAHWGCATSAAGAISGLRSYVATAQDGGNKPTTTNGKKRRPEHQPSLK